MHSVCIVGLIQFSLVGVVKATEVCDTGAGAQDLSWTAQQSISVSSVSTVLETMQYRSLRRTCDSLLVKGSLCTIVTAGYVLRGISTSSGVPNFACMPRSTGPS